MTRKESNTARGEFSHRCVDLYMQLACNTPLTTTPAASAAVLMFSALSASSTSTVTWGDTRASSINRCKVMHVKGDVKSHTHNCSINHFAWNDRRMLRSVFRACGEFGTVDDSATLPVQRVKSHKRIGTMERFRERCHASIIWHCRYTARNVNNSCLGSTKLPARHAPGSCVPQQSGSKPRHL